VEVGAADAAGFDFEEDLTGARLGDGQVFEAQRVAGDGSGMVEDSGAHDSFSRKRTIVRFCVVVCVMDAAVDFT
jgi:hypothetical protein